MLLIVATILSLLCVACDDSTSPPSNVPSGNQQPYLFRTEGLILDKNGKDSTEFWEDGLESYITDNLLNWASEDSGSVTISSDYTVNDYTYKIEYNFAYNVDNVDKSFSALIKIKRNHTYIIGIKDCNLYFYGNQGNNAFRMALRDYAPIESIENSFPVAADSLTTIMLRSLLRLGDNVVYGKNGKVSEYIADVNFSATLNKFKSVGKRAEELGAAQKALESVGTFIKNVSNTYFNTELTSLDATDGEISAQFPLDDIKLKASYVMNGEKPLAKIESFYIDFYSPKSDKRAFSGEEHRSCISFYGLKKNVFNGDIFSTEMGKDSDYIDISNFGEECREVVKDPIVGMLADAFMQIITMLG